MSTESIDLRTISTDLKDIKPKNITVKAIALPENDHCIVKLLDKYLSLLPSDASYFICDPKTRFLLSNL